MAIGVLPRLYRRAVLIYLGTILVPVAAFLWLGLDSFERQRQVLVERTDETLLRELETRTEDAARAAFLDPQHPIVRHTFAIEHGVVVRPALRAALPELPPAEFADVYRLEASRPDLALASYRTLVKTASRRSLAWQGVARCLERLGRTQEAREAWRTLAREYPDDRDLSHRPYGIVAAIAADDTEGLYDLIVSERWELPADQAIHFLSTLDPERTTPYLERMHFAQELAEHFRPQGVLGEHDIYTFSLSGRRVFYRRDGPDGIAGFLVHEPWIETTLRPRIERELDVAGATQRNVRLYLGSVGLVLALLSGGVILLLRDVSREARTNRVRADLVSGVSHELKTPITLIRLYSETLLRHRGFPEDDRLGFYRIIARESTRLGRLVDQVLTFSRVDRGAQVYHVEEGDLSAVVHGVLEDYREYLEHAGFQLTQVVPDTVPPVRFDGAAISQALVNLLDNAVKYSGDAKQIAVRLDVAAAQVAIEVEDHGIGIPAAEQGKIFDRFYRASNGNGTGGYGLGLFLVRHIMDAHRGRAEVDSQPGRGSCFRLILPTAASWASSASS